jgi:lysophospholipase
MRVNAKRVKIQGHLLHRVTLNPEDSVSVKGCAIFYHGQGDYADRYADVLAPFTENGIRCVITDLLGHGYSPGRRGHCGDEALLDAVIHNTLQSFEGLPYGVMGHSMGGLLAARHLVLSGQGKLPPSSWAWLNAPLIRPSNNRSRVFLKIVKLAAFLFPELTITTGVTSEMCRVKVDSEGGVPQKRVRHPLWHQRISLGWGAVLLNSEELIQKEVFKMDCDCPILVTQGGDDLICPAEITQKFFESLPQTDKKYVEFEDGLHELFSEDGNERLSSVLREWLGSH